MGAVLLFPAVSLAWGLPQAPGKVQGSRSASGQSFTVSWSSPAFKTDGNALAPGELASFKVIRSNALTGGTTSVSFTVSVSSAPSYTDAAIAGRTFFYRIKAVDSAGGESADSAAASSDAGNTVYFMADDGTSYAAVPGILKAALDAEGSFIRGTRLVNAEGNRVYKSIHFDVFDSLTNQARQDYILSSPASFGLAYSVGGDGRVFLNDPLPAVFYPDAAGAKFAFSVYWNNGADYLKVGSSVDTANKVAVTASRLPGSYQLRLVSQALSSQLNAVYPRTITPNNDGINDRVFFLFENPSGAPASGSVFDAQSEKVSDLKSTDLFGGDTVLYWDGTDDNGAVAAGGYYIYKLEAGGRKFAGTVAVAR